MTTTVLSKIKEEYEGYKIVGELTYDDQTRQTSCLLTADVNGKEFLSQRETYNYAMKMLQQQIDTEVEVLKLREELKSFVLVPIELGGDYPSLYASLEECYETEDGWKLIDEDIEAHVVDDNLWDIYDIYHVAIPTKRSKLTKKQEEKLDKLMKGLSKNIVNSVRDEVLKILGE